MAPPSARVAQALRGSWVRLSPAKAMAGQQKEKVVPDEVHQNQILRELYLRELRTQKLYTQYHVNPLRKGEGRRGEEEPCGVRVRGGGVGAEHSRRGLL